MNFYAELKHYHGMMKTSRKAMGYTIGNDQHYITAFIEFCEDSFPSAAQVTQEMVDSWLCSYDFRNPKTQANVVSLLRTYCRFLSSLGVQGYVPDDDHTIRSPKYHPYIFTDTELVSLFRAFDTIQPHPYGPNREYIFPVLFRMMYCCGMRPTEPLRLKTEDVNLHTGEIYIRQSKQNKDRRIMMSGDMQRLCQRYDAAVGKREWFFQKWDDGPFTGEWTRNQMDRCWKTTGLVKRQNLRPYDLRHNFATRSIMKWVDNGDDVMALLPYLSTYMGHTKFTHTLYYVHLLPERLRNSSNINWDIFRKIYDRRRLKMMKIKDPALFKTMKEFLTHYLPEVRRKSPNTILSYKAAINLFLKFLSEEYNKKLAKITASDFNADHIQKFMDWLRGERKNVSTTVNLRMTHIRQFCKYLQKCGLVSYADYVETKEISKQPDNRKKDFIYLSIDKMKLVLKMPDTNKKAGLRDKFFIAILYDSGCRDQEMLDLQLRNFLLRDDGKAELQIIGKGNKYRVIPISEEVVALYQDYRRVYHPQSSGNHYLFYTLRKGVVSKMSDDNVARFLEKYEQMAKVEDSMIPHLHAHIFRRSRAMHLYEAGVPLPLISEWLGHSQLETTQIYARVSLDMKRNAAETLAAQSGQIFSDEKFRYDDDDMIRKLYGLD